MPLLGEEVWNVSEREVVSVTVAVTVIAGAVQAPDSFGSGFWVPVGSSGSSGSSESSGPSGSFGSGVSVGDFLVEEDAWSVQMDDGFSVRDGFSVARGV